MAGSKTLVSVRLSSQDLSIKNTPWQKAVQLKNIGDKFHDNQSAPWKTPEQWFEGRAGKAACSSLFLAGANNTNKGRNWGRSSTRQTGQKARERDLTSAREVSRPRLVWQRWRRKQPSRARHVLSGRAARSSRCQDNKPLRIQSTTVARQQLGEMEAVGGGRPVQQHMDFLQLFDCHVSATEQTSLYNHNWKRTNVLLGRF